MTGRMSDERLAQLSIPAQSSFPFDHPTTRIVQDAIGALVAEAKRARGEEEALRDDNTLLRVDLANVFPDREALADDAIAAHEENERLQDLLGSIWLYVGWRSATRSLTTDQRELWADAVDAKSMRGQAEDGEEPHPVAERWWRDDFVEAARLSCGNDPSGR
jgi:hypothetical protein